MHHLLDFSSFEDASGANGEVNVRFRAGIPDLVVGRSQLYQSFLGFQHARPIAGIIKLPIWGDQTLQMYGKFEGFPINSALFGLVI